VLPYSNATARSYRHPFLKQTLPTVDFNISMTIIASKVSRITTSSYTYTMKYHITYVQCQRPIQHVA